MKKLNEYNVLIIDDQPTAMEAFTRRFENHRIVLDDVVYEIHYIFQVVELSPKQGEDGRWCISEETLESLSKHFREDRIDLVMIDYAFVPPEKDEELTYKLTHSEISTKEELLGIYVVDASELFELLIQNYRSLRQIVRNKSVQYLMYTYPADSLMHLLGDAKQRMNKLSRILEREIDVLDTRQLLYGGDKELEQHHNRRLYPQLLGGYLNQLAFIYMQKKIQKLIPLYKKIKVRKSVFSVTTIAAFAGGIAFATEFIVSNIITLWPNNRYFSILLILILILFVFLAGSFFAIFFERLVRNLVVWLEKG